MEISDARKLKALEEENRKLKNLLAETMLDASTLREMLAGARSQPISPQRNLADLSPRTGLVMLALRFFRF